MRLGCFQRARCKTSSLSPRRTSQDGTANASTVPCTHCFSCWLFLQRDLPRVTACVNCVRGGAAADSSQVPFEQARSDLSHRMRPVTILKFQRLGANSCDRRSSDVRKTALSMLIGCGNERKSTSLVILMLGLLLIAFVGAISFAAGYWTRTVVSRRRRANYLKWEPYVRPSRPAQPPQFLVRSHGGNVAHMPKVASHSRRGG